MRFFLHLILDLIRVVLRYLRPGGTRALLAENLILRQQLMVVKRRKVRAANFSSAQRFIFAILSFAINPKRLPKLAFEVGYQSLLKFHRALRDRKYSILFSTKTKSPGRKGYSKEIINLILEIKTKNPSYGCPRIALLVKEVLGIPIDDETVRRILKKYLFPIGSGPSWLTKIGKSPNHLWSLDFFCVESLWLSTYWIMVIMDQYSRRIIGFEVHKGNLNGPAICFMLNKIICNQNIKPKYLSMDHDPLFRYYQWQANLRIYEIEAIQSIPNIPWSHPFIERLIGTVRREYLDSIIFRSTSDLEDKLREFMIYYNEARVHYAHTGGTPHKLSGGEGLQKIRLEKYSWKSYCNGRFEIPVAA